MSLSSFDFDMCNPYQQIYQACEGIYLTLTRYSDSIAVLSFTNEMKETIPIPEGIVVYTCDYSETNCIKEKPRNDSYILCWTEDYVIHHKKNLLLKITNKRTWDILQYTTDNLKNNSDIQEKK